MKYLILVLLLTTSALADFSIQKHWDHIFVDKGSYCSKLCDASSLILADEAVDDNRFTPTHSPNHPINIDEEIQQIIDFKNKCKKQCDLPRKPGRGRQKRPKASK